MKHASFVIPVLIDYPGNIISEILSAMTTCKHHEFNEKFEL